MAEQTEKRIEVSVDTLTTETAELVLTSIINNVAMRQNEYQVAIASIKLLTTKAKQLESDGVVVPDYL